ncbi:hypothetical protein [Methylobacterium frigidaeris]|uniref:Uncharacterized protein n=1 Tax=Methylobacterium frigidaeris TaxID=2038277 RepID=A0AA37M704_9HYPH|nr:hypothetical protein [Methylobacterium frigidaeris]GJD64419.1 hypothetical protein MPEAHAMD_4601 [Methylobacterium frigidaeris]
MSDNLPARTRPRGKLPSLAPYLEAEGWSARVGDRAEHIRFPAIPATRPSDSPRQVYEAKRYALKVLRDAVARFPAPHELAMAAEALSGAIQAPPDRAVVQTAIALMLDARTRLPPNPQAYIEALTYDLTDMGFPPAAVVAGCQRVRREATFMPEIAEVVAACREASNRYRLQAHHAERASDEVLRMQEVIYRLNEELAATPEPEEER